MENSIRYNKIIELLENDQVVFAPALVSNGPSDDITYIADSEYDMVMISRQPYSQGNFLSGAAVFGLWPHSIKC